MEKHDEYLVSRQQIRCCLPECCCLWTRELASTGRQQAQPSFRRKSVSTVSAWLLTYTAYSWLSCQILLKIFVFGRRQKICGPLWEVGCEIWPTLDHLANELVTRWWKNYWTVAHFCILGYWLSQQLWGICERKCVKSRKSRNAGNQFISLSLQGFRVLSHLWSPQTR